MSVTGLPGQGPVRVRHPRSPISSRGLYLAFGILMALLEREQSGEGQWVQTSLLEAQIAHMDFRRAWLIDKERAGAGRQQPSEDDSDRHLRDQGRPHQYRRRRAEPLDQALQGARRRGADRAPEFADRSSGAKNLDAVQRRADELTRKRTSAEWVDILNDAGVPCGPVYSVDQTFADPQVRHLGIAAKVAHPKLGERRAGRAADPSVARVVLGALGDAGGRRAQRRDSVDAWL